jgi:hypothetical protein
MSIVVCGFVVICGFVVVCGYGHVMVQTVRLCVSTTINRQVDRQGVLTNKSRVA